MSKVSKNKAAVAVPSIELLRSGVQLLDPDFSAENAKIAIVAAKFNAAIVDRLVDAAIQTLRAAGVLAESITLVRVPGAWELPIVANALAETGEIDGIVALGCIIRGETAHFDVITRESASGLMRVALEHSMPVSNGVLACENEEQALQRCGGAENKGAEAAQALMETLGVMSTMEMPLDDLLEQMDWDLGQEGFR